MNLEMQFWDGLREWASRCLAFWKDVGSTGRDGFVTPALMSYWVVLLIPVARVLLGMNEQGRYRAPGER